MPAETRSQRLARLSRQRVQDAKRTLRQLHGVDNARARAFASSAPIRSQITAGGLPRTVELRPGQYNVAQYGREPNSADLARFIASTGGNPYQQKLARMNQRQSAQAVAAASQPVPAQSAPVPAQPDLFEQAFAQAAADSQRARDENLKRYAEGHGELTGLRTRRQEGLANLGKTQQQLNDERAQEALDRQTAMLSASGIANSNVLPAFAQRNARDLALVQQKLAEDVALRKGEVDAQDTGNLVSFVERRNDTGPDQAQLLQLAMQHGQNVDDAELAKLKARQANAGKRRRYRPRSGAPRYGSLGGGVISLGPGDFGIPNWALPGGVGFVRRPRYSRRNRSAGSNRKILSAIGGAGKSAAQVADRNQVLLQKAMPALPIIPGIAAGKAIKKALPKVRNWLQETFG